MKRYQIFFSCIMGICLISLHGSGQNQKPVLVDTKTIVITASKFQITQPENTMLLPKKDKEKEERQELLDREHRVAQTFKFSVADGPEYGNDPSSIQTIMGTKKALSALTTWDGQDGGADPQDPTGAVGLTQYVQAVNATPFAVYNKTGNGTPVFTGSIGTVTGSGTDGDPIVLYDKFADRWFVGQLNNNGFAVAVSRTNNPAGQWNAYQFNMPSGEFPDYLKFSVWCDGYYMTSNNGYGTVICLERAAMLIGTAGARAVITTFTQPANAGQGFWLPLPADADGVIPPSGSRCPLFAYTDNAWGSGQIDGIKIWSVGVTWGTTASANITLDATIATTAFDASYNSNWNDITQPGTQQLDGLGGVCMYRAQWNSFPLSNRVVLNWAIKISTTQRSIKWVELRQNTTSGTWSLYQQGTYAPDAANRWNGSIAMDCNGDIALCYAKTSSTIPISLAYTGRLASDPLGTMTLAETVVFTGLGSITGTNRFGDYSHTSVDPVHNDIFWHTGMYCKNISQTGIYSFQISPYTGIDEIKIQKPELFASVDGKIINVKATNLPSNDESVLQLFDISGKMIYNGMVKPVSNSIISVINGNKLVPGFYLIRIGTQDYQKVIKISFP